MTLVHEALCYSGDEEFLAVVLPFLADGVADGQPTMVSLAGHHAGLVRSALPAGSPVGFLTGDTYSRPAATIRDYRTLMASHAAAGARQIRVVGELPAGYPATWDRWARYESAINRAYDEFPTWAICAYDRRVAPAAVLRDVARTHPRFAGGAASTAYTDPVTFLSEPVPVVADPVQHGRPVAELTDPMPSAARRAVRDAGHDGIAADDVEDLMLAVTEVVTNAMVHGRPPVEVRVWTGPDRIVVTVTDAGPGPQDPFAGLLPSPGTDTSGRGLWITYQTVSHVAVDRTGGRFTIRLTAGNPS